MKSGNYAVYSPRTGYICGDNPCWDCPYRHTVCGLEILQPDYPQKRRKARKTRAFCISGFLFSGPWRRDLKAIIRFFSNRDFASH